MNIQVRFRGVEGSRSLVELATRRVHRHLSRFGHQVTSVMVRISDQNGPRGGRRDKRCDLTATGPRIGTVHLSESHDDVHACLDVALDRFSYAIGRSLDRSRQSHPAVIERSAS